MLELWNGLPMGVKIAIIILLVLLALVLLVVIVKKLRARQAGLAKT